MADRYPTTVNKKYQGKLLVSTPALDKDPNFISTVVYIYEESPDVIVGVTLNRPTEIPVDKIVQMKSGIVAGELGQLHKGGPVSQQSLLLLHTDEWYSSNTIQIGQGLALSSDNFMFEKMTQGNKPYQYRLIAGVSSWHPDQLENEIHRWKAWLVCELPDTDFIFDFDRTEQWDRAIQVTGQQVIDKFF
jgi:putative transcriptional regulator